MYETSVLKKRNLFTSHWVQRMQFQVTFSVFPKVTTLNFLKLRIGRLLYIYEDGGNVVHTTLENLSWC